MKYFYSIQVLLLLICHPAFVLPQNDCTQDLVNVEASLRVYQDLMFSSSSPAVRDENSDEFLIGFRDILNKPSSFSYSFDSLKHVGKIESGDKKFRIYTWNLSLTGGYQKYFGLIQLMKDNNSVEVIELYDNRKSIRDPLNDILTKDTWYGALYYSIIPRTNNGVTQYILLGLDFNNLFSSKKVIDVLSFDEKGLPIFGSPVFRVFDNRVSRIIFEYSARASMTVKYIDEAETIVFDHLSPSRPDYTGNYQFYGPDFTFDGFRYEKGEWIYHQNIDVRNPKRVKKELKDVPEKLPEPGFLYKSKSSR